MTSGPTLRQNVAFKLTSSPRRPRKPTVDLSEDEEKEEEIDRRLDACPLNPGFGSRGLRTFQRYVASILQKQPELQIICNVSDGLEAIQKAEELQPDLILLDVGLPSLNGIEVARQIRKVSPKSKILFVSQESSADVVQGALGTGAQGYVVKSDAKRELLDGVNAVLRGEQFVGNRFSDL